MYISNNLAVEPALKKKKKKEKAYKDVLNVSSVCMYSPKNIIKT